MRPDLVDPKEVSEVLCLERVLAESQSQFKQRLAATRRRGHGVRLHDTARGQLRTTSECEADGRLGISW